MNCVYDKEYLPYAQRVMGDMLDYAVNTLGYELKVFFDMFIISGMARQFEIFNPKYVVGKNGCEIAREVVEQATGIDLDYEDIMYLDKSPEYWTGWSLVYYQWNSGESYKSINNYADIDFICGMYGVGHEADVEWFIEKIDERRHQYYKESQLRRLRMYAGLTQAALAKKSGVALRQIQMFEQGQRDVRKTSAETLLALSRVLECDMYDLMKNV